MAEAFFSFEPFDYGRSVHDTRVPLQYNKGAPPMQVFSLSDEEYWGDLDFLCSQYASYPDYIPQKSVVLSETPQQPPPPPSQFSEFGILDDFQFNTVSPPFQTPEDSLTLDSVLSELSDIIQPKNEKPYPKPMASLELLNGYKSGGYNKMNGGKLNEKPTQPRRVDNPQRLSTEEVMRVAGAQYIQFAVRKDDHNLSMLSHPFGCSFSGLSDEETQEVELAHLLLASAEKIGNQQYDRGNKLRTQCAYMSSSTGSPVQRIAYYFSQALLERINRETGRVSSMGGKGGSDQDLGVVIAIEEEMLSPNPAILECHQVLPFSQVLLFPAVQAIVESVALAKKVHVIDLGIKTGVPWTILMQALAVRHDCPLEMLKVTAVGTKGQHEMQETGKRLTSFAESMDIPFLFKLVMVTNLEDLKEEMIELEEDDAVAISAPLVLRTLLIRSESLDSLMRVIRNLNPCIMVVIEVEANHNSPSFFNRFIEALFYFSAYFDCLEACMDRNNNTRLTTEALYFGQAIMNIVAMEGEERTHRHVGIDVWRAFFARFGMVEIEFSHSSTYQANLVSKQFACASSCTVDMNEKCLTVGWKGTPLHSLSVWKFR
ncbi:hypothetical protein ACHQM5_014359 [Ranunculus cassubicifolius]